MLQNDNIPETTTEPDQINSKTPMTKLPHKAIYFDKRLSDKEMTAVYSEKSRAYWITTEPGNKVVFMLLDTMYLDNLHPHPENNLFY